MTVEEALELARRHGVNVVLEGDSLHLEADAPPPNGLLAILGRDKWDIVAVLRQREAEERRRIVQWINADFSIVAQRLAGHAARRLRLVTPGSVCSCARKAFAPGPKAERVAICIVVECLNRAHPDTPWDCCAGRGEPETSDFVLLLVASPPARIGRIRAVETHGPIPPPGRGGRDAR